MGTSRGAHRAACGLGGQRQTPQPPSPGSGGSRAPCGPSPQPSCVGWAPGECGASAFPTGPPPRPSSTGAGAWVKTRHRHGHLPGAVLDTVVIQPREPLDFQVGKGNSEVTSPCPWYYWPSQSEPWGRLTLGKEKQLTVALGPPQALHPLGRALSSGWGVLNWCCQ